MGGEAPQTCDVAFATHPGSRARQEDALFVGGRCMLPSEQNPLASEVALLASKMVCTVPFMCALADGIGGHHAGDVASETCVKNLAAFWAESEKDLPLQRAVSGIQKVIEETSLELHKLALAEVELKDLGTTLVVLVVCQDGCAVLNLGDSRAYGFAEGNLWLLTRDDTEAQRLVDLNLLSKDDLATLSQRDGLTQYVGKYEPGLIVRARETSLTGDEQLVLLCSDGVSKQLSDEEMKNLLSAEDDILKRVRMLVETAVRKPDADNTSAILIRMGQ